MIQQEYQQIAPLRIHESYTTFLKSAKISRDDQFHINYFVYIFCSVMYR